MRVAIPEIRRYLEIILKRFKIRPADARIIADEYLEGELQGKASHGLMAFPSLIEKLQARKKPFNPRIIKKTQSMVFFDADGFMGSVVGRKAADRAIAMAKKQGFGVGLITNMTTWLRPGTIAKYVADKGCIGIVCNNGGSAMVAHPDGIDPVIGTNPIGMGIPTTKESIVADMATSVRAWGEVRKAMKSGERLPLGAFIDARGQSTRRASEAHAAESMGGYKGFALGLLIEILTGSMLGRPMGKAADQSGEYRTATRGGCILVINPAIIGGNQTFRSANSALLRSIKTSKKRKRNTEIRIPGENVHQKRVSNMKKGVLNVDKELWTSLRKEMP